MTDRIERSHRVDSAPSKAQSEGGRGTPWDGAWDAFCPTVRFGGRGTLSVPRFCGDFSHILEISPLFSRREIAWDAPLYLCPTSHGPLACRAWDTSVPGTGLRGGRRLLAATAPLSGKAGSYHGAQTHRSKNRSPGAEAQPGGCSPRSRGPHRGVWGPARTSISPCRRWDRVGSAPEAEDVAEDAGQGNGWTEVRR